MSCLQHHQLTGTHEGVRTDAAQLLVPSEEPEEGEARVFVFFCAPARDSQAATHNLCIFVPLKASLATSLMPFLVSRLSGEKSQVTEKSPAASPATSALLLSPRWL